MRRRKKNNDDNKAKIINTITIIGIICLIGILVLILINSKKTENHIISVNYEEYSELILEDKYNIIILTSPTCLHCKNYKPYVNYVCDDYNLKAYELSINTLTYDEYMTIHDKYQAIKNHYNDKGEPSILTPTTIITKNGEEIASISGNLGYSGLIELLKTNEIIKEK